MPTGELVTKTGTALGSGETDESKLKQPGADRVSGVVTRSTTSYNVNLRWLDGAGNVVETESVNSNVTGGNQATFDSPARSPYVEVQVDDAGAGSGDFDLVAHLR